MNKLIGFVIHNRNVVLLIAVLVAGIGVWSWFQLGLEAYPDISENDVEVVTQLDGLPAEEMEQQVTVPIERVLNTVPDVIAKRSKTIFGLSDIDLVFNDKINIYLARQLVQEKLKEADLPEGAEPEISPLSMPMGEIFRYVIEAPDTMSLTDLRELQDYVIIPKLRQAEGVVDVENFGGLIKQFQVVINPLQLAKYNLQVQNIADAITANNKNTGGNYLRIGLTQMDIRGVGRIANANDIGNIVVDNRSGIPILVKDIASVEIGNFPPTCILGYTDKTKGKSRRMGIEGMAQLKKYENPSKTIVGIYQKVDELNNGLLPRGVKVQTFYDRTILVNLTIHTVAKTLLEGMICVLLVLTLMLGSWRAAVISAAAIPFSLLFAFICMYMKGIPANLLSLGAIDFGIIVDASIIMVEAIFRNIGQSFVHDKDHGIQNAILHSAREMQRQILYTVSIIIIALLPIFALQRVEGRLFSPMVWTLSFAILGSMIYSVTLVPVLGTYLFNQNTIEHKNFLWEFIQRAYRIILRRLLRIPKTVLLASVLVVAGGIFLWTHLGSEFLPELDEGSIWIRVFLPAGISLEAAQPYPDMIRKELAKYDEVTGVLTQSGRTDAGTDPFGPNRIEALVLLKQPYSSWKSHRTKKQFVIDMKNRLMHLIPGAGFTISQPIIDMVTEQATGSSSDLAVFINGKNIDTLRKYAEQILSFERNIPGASETALEQEGKQTQLMVEIDRNATARYGVNISDVNAMLEMAIGGIPVSSVWEGDRKFDIILRFTRESRNTPEQIGKILVTSKSGLKIPLDQLAKIRLVNGETIICREEQEHTLTVKTNIRGRDQGGFAGELGKKIDAQVKLPENYSYSLGGQFENLKRSQDRLLLVIPVALFLIFSVLLVFFRYQFVYAMMVMTNIPLAAVGGIAALYIRGINISISAGVGFVSLAGVCVMTGVLWLSYLNKLENRKRAVFLDEIIKGSLVQFRPVFIILVIAIIGLLPAALNTGVGSDVQRPLATVIVGGLTTTLLFTPIFLPVLYYWIERRKCRGIADAAQ